MSTSRWISVVALFLSTASATFLSPAPEASWDVNSQHEIQWDTAGLKAPLQMHLAPGSYDKSSYDSSSYIGTLTPSIPNSGKWQWYPKWSIPQHSTYIIIIVDSGGHYQYSPPFYMIGWPQKGGYTPPYIYTPPSYTSTAAPIQLEPVVITSIQVEPMIVTSQPPPMIKTIEQPPLIETQMVAPIIMTRMQDAMTKIVTQPFLFSTEYPAPIVKCVTEMQAPIVHTVTQMPLTIIETRPPIIITEIKAPIIKTMYQPPKIMTEVVAPIVITEQITKTIQFTSFVNVAPINTYAPGKYNEYQPPSHYVPPVEYVAPVHSTAPSEYMPPVHSAAPVYNPVVIHTPVKYPEVPVYSTLVPVATVDSVQPAPPIFLNSSSIDIPAFTTPLALLATNPGVATTTGLGGLTPSFTPNAGGRSSVVSVGLMGGLMTLVMILI